MNKNIKDFNESDLLLSLTEPFGFTNSKLNDYKYLIENGLNVNYSNGGYTLLMTAVLAPTNTYDLIKLLVENGANLEPKNNHGENAIDLANAIGKLDVANYLTSIRENQIITKDLQDLAPQQTTKKAPVFKM
jgi:ankyrin repeat protein